MKVTIENYQSIKKADLEVKGLTVITGPSDIGKSAIVRAIRDALFNGAGAEFVRKNQSQARVSLEDTDFKVVWEKGKTSGRYEVNGENYEKPGRGPLPEVVKAARIYAVEDSLNPSVQTQHEYAFILASTESQISQAISSLSRAAEANDAARECVKDLKQVKSKHKVRQEDLVKAQKSIVPFKKWDAIRVNMQKLRDASAEMKEKQDLQARAISVASKRESAKGLALEGIKPYRVDISKGLQTLRDSKQYAKLSSREMPGIGKPINLSAAARIEALEKLEKVKKLRFQLVLPQVGELNGEKVLVPLLTTRHLRVQIRDQKAVTVKIEKQLENLSEVKHQLEIKMGTCPTCNRNFQESVHEA